MRSPAFILPFGFALIYGTLLPGRPGRAARPSVFRTRPESAARPAGRSRGEGTLAQWRKAQKALEPQGLKGAPSVAPLGAMAHATPAGKCRPAQGAPLAPRPPAPAHAFASDALTEFCWRPRRNS